VCLSSVLHLPFFSTPACFPAVFALRLRQHTENVLMNTSPIYHAYH
jgi:hypothetical protein